MAANNAIKTKPGSALTDRASKPCTKKENMTLAILNTKAAQTMTSREIAELTGKEHKNVLRDISVMLDELGLDKGGYAQTWAHPQNGQTYPEYALDRELTETLLTGYSAVLRRKVIARWRELEAMQTPAIPKTMAQALRLAADQAEQIEAQQSQLAIAAPKVEFVDHYVDATGLKGFRQVAKLLGIKEPTLRKFLTENQIQYKLGGEWTAYQCHIDAGRFSVKAGASKSGHAYNTAEFTPKGIAWIAGLIASKDAIAALLG